MLCCHACFVIGTMYFTTLLPLLLINIIEIIIATNSYGEEAGWVGGVTLIVLTHACIFILIFILIDIKNSYLLHNVTT